MGIVKNPSWNKYYDSDSATQLFRPFAAQGTRRGMMSYGWGSADARKKYAVNEKKIEQMQWLFWLTTVVLFFGAFWIVQVVNSLHLPNPVYGAFSGLVMAVLLVTFLFILPVVFEQYCYKRGWLKASIKSNRKQ